MEPVKIPTVLKLLAKQACAPVISNEKIGGEFSASRQALSRSVNQLRDLADKIEAFLKETSEAR